MTETEWLTCENHWVMQTHLGDQFWSHRKLSLFTVACCRRWWSDLPIPQLKTCLDVVERFADENASEDELGDAQQQLLACGELLVVFREDLVDGNLDILIPLDANFEYLFIWDKSGFRAEDANLLRCLQGNPFRPVTFDPRWQTETVVALAAGIYEDRAFERMPILADALQEAGCDNEQVLSHCREPGQHVRGCWIVDLLLGKQ